MPPMTAPETSEGSRRQSTSWAARDALKSRFPALLRVYRRHVAPLVVADKRPTRLARWAEEGEKLRAELGVPAFTFEPDGVWVTDEAGLQWRYLPGVFLSAVGKELGVDHDPAEIAHVKQRVSAGGTFVDIGGHAGGYSIPVALSGDGVTIYTFEPVPASRDLLVGNITRNGAEDRITVWPNAVADRAGTMRITAGNSMENHLVTDGQPSAGSVDVEVITLDEFVLPKADRVDAIKIDVEGAELMVLQGGRALLERDHPDIVIELDERLTPRFGYHPREVVTFLEGLGYGWERFVGGQRRPATDVGTALAEGNNFLFTAAAS